MDRNLRIRMLLEAGDKVTRPLRDMAGGSKLAADALRKTRGELKAIDRAQADIASFRSLKMGLRTTEQSLYSAQTRVAALAREMRATDQPSRKLAAEFARAKREAASLGTQLDREKHQLQAVRDKLHNAGMATRNLTNHERRLRDAAARTNDELKEQERRLRTTSDRAARFAKGRERFQKMQGTAIGMAASGTAGIATGVAIGAPIYAAAQDAMGFEDAMADVRKVVDGLDTPKAFAAMSKDVLDLSKRLPMAAEGIAAIVASGGQAGLARKELLPFAEDATKMAIAFDVTADEAGETMAKWRTAFAVGREGVLKLGDQINLLGNTTAAKAPLITDIVTRIGPLGAVGGLASGQIAALGATLGGMGIESEIAATGIENTMLALTKGEAATKKQAEAYQALGLDAVAVSKAMQVDAGGTIVDVMQRIGKLPKEAQSGLLTQLFGSESVAAIAPMLTQLDTLRDNFRKVGDETQYAGSMEAEYASRAATTSNAVQLANNQIRASKIAIGNQLLPTVAKGAAMFARIAEAVGKFTRAHPGMAKALAIGVGLFAVLFMILGGGAILIAGLIAPFAALSFAAGALGIGLLPVIGIAAAVVIGIIALGAAGYALWVNWDTICDYIGTRFTGLRDSVMADLRAIGDFFASMPSRFTQSGRDMIDGLIGGLLGRMKVLKDSVTNIASSVATWFKDKLGIRSPSRVFMGFGGNIVQGLTNGIAARESEPIRRIDGLSRRLASAVTAGAMIPAIASPALAAGMGEAASPAPSMTVTINITQQPGQSSQDLAQAIADELDRRMRSDAAAARSSFADTDEWGA